MAIVFTKDISEADFLKAYNNNITRFNSDSMLTVANAEITGLTPVPLVLQPHPDGSFYFNLKDYASNLINTKNFVDDLEYGNFDPSDSLSLTYGVNDNCYLMLNLEFKIIFADTTFETVNKTYHFITAVEQLNDTFGFDNFGLNLLSPSKVIKYWKGYPFEFSFINGLSLSDDEVFSFYNTVGNSIEIPSKQRVNSLFLTDGVGDVNFLDAFSYSEPRSNIQKIEANAFRCGLYIKFLNKFGRWNYWLFQKYFFQNRSSKYLGEIENDFNDIVDTISPTLQIGKLSDSTIKCAAKNLNENDKLVLEQILDSPKILLFKGKPNEVATNKDWFEVRLKTSNLQTHAPNKKIYNFYLELDLPLRNTIKL